MGNTSRRTLNWPIALIAVLAIPVLLLAGWSWLVFGGTLDRLEREETRQAEAFLNGYASQVQARLLTLDQEQAVLVIEHDAEGKVTSPFLSQPILSQPILSQPILSQPVQGQPALSTAAGEGIQLELQGKHKEALAWFEHARDNNKEPSPPQVALSYARCLAATGQAASALDLLKKSEAEHRDSWIGALPLPILSTMLRARIAAEQGDTSIAQQALRDLATLKLRCTARITPTVITQIRRFAGSTEQQTDTEAGLQTLLAAAKLSTRDSLPLQSALMPDGSYAKVEPGRILLAGPSLVEAILSEAQVKAKRATPSFAFSTTGDRALAAKTITPFGNRIYAISTTPLGSTRLRSLANGLLILALVTLALGNLLLFRLARREMALSHMRANFIDLVSHELRTPLTALSMKTEMLAHDDVPKAKIPSYQRALFGDVQRLTELVNRILDFARLEKGRIPLNRQICSVRNLLAAAVHSGRPALQLGGQKLTIKAARDLPELCVDTEILARAVRNLIENATHYAPSDSKISISARQQDQTIELLVEDQGPGFGDTDPNELFTAFRRGKDHATSPGSGLGLAIVRQAVEAHKGAVTASQSDAGGARFTITLPISLAITPPRGEQT